MLQIGIMVGAIILSVFVVIKILRTEELVMKLFLIFFIFMIVTGSAVYIQSDASLSPKGMIDFTKTYLVWFSDAFDGAKSFSGRISEQDWKMETPKNKTN